MSARCKDYDAVVKTINNYIKGTYEGDVPLFKTAFHEKAMISGFIHMPDSPPEGVFFFENISALYGYMESTESPKASGASYEARIGSVEVFGDMAHVVVYEDGLADYNFVNQLHLHLIGDEWLITNKAFNGVHA